MRVDLLVTGRAEAAGLAEALDRLFPGHEFRYVWRNEKDRELFPGFTTGPLPARPSQALPQVRKIVEEILARLVATRRRSQRPDFVVVLDDLELVNAHRPAVATQVFAEQVRAHLEFLEQVRDSGFVDRCRDALREKASLHFANPMVEAWFFADPGALSQCGVADTSQVEWNDSGDPEDFETTETTYLSATESDCPCWQSLESNRKKKKLRPKWLGDLNRSRHPKGYIQWLCRDGAARTCTRYQETKNGGAALAGLDWALVLARPDDHFAYLRALVDDLADALGEDPITGPVREPGAAATSRSRRPRNPVLRNL